ncbi:unnamed protein product [Vicia faba]|uniref:Uncharacterized protein n=1 Tax=Vicia faba TaxID=3906 RepID=A0AAV0ZPP2_VICFA|nr:unnamed protein product [Vicia faba]
MPELPKPHNQAEKEKKIWNFRTLITGRNTRYDHLQWLCGRLRTAFGSWGDADGWSVEAEEERNELLLILAEIAPRRQVSDAFLWACGMEKTFTVSSCYEIMLEEANDGAVEGRSKMAFAIKIINFCVSLIMVQLLLKSL